MILARREVTHWNRLRHRFVIAGLSLRQQLQHVVQVRIPSPKRSGKPVSSPSSDLVTIDEHVELARFPRRNHRRNTKPLLNQGREPRNLGLVVLSGRTGDDFNFQFLYPFHGPSCRSEYTGDSEGKCLSSTHN